MSSTIDLLQSFYDMTRIPLWIYSADRKALLYKIFTNLPNLIPEKLADYNASLTFTPKTDFFSFYVGENECYACFTPKPELLQTQTVLIAGPILINARLTTSQQKNLGFASLFSLQELETLCNALPACNVGYSLSATRHLLLLLGLDAPSVVELYKLFYTEQDEHYETRLVEELFQNQEDLLVHTPYAQELAVLNCVRDGDAAMLETIYRSQPEIVYGNMSSQPLKKLLYGCIANTTLVTRYAIQGGLDEEVAFTLSDVYIQQMDKCRSLAELNHLNESMAIEFTLRVAEAKEQARPKYSKPILKCIDYITLNTHQKLTLELLAEEVDLTPKYLSFLFKKETGESVRAFIEDRKIAEARNLLLYTRYSYSEISEYLAFSSQSHFISVFKKNTGQTPKEFRESH